MAKGAAGQLSDARSRARPPSLAEKQLAPPAETAAGQYFKKIPKYQENIRKTKESGEF